MPEGLSKDEQWLFELEEAKYAVKKNLLVLGSLIGQEDARQWVEQETYPFLPF